MHDRKGITENQSGYPDLCKTQKDKRAVVKLAKDLEERDGKFLRELSKMFISSLTLLSDNGRYTCSSPSD